jgi:hypothetical protein
MVLTPHVRAALCSHLTPKQQAFLVELDRVKQVQRGWAPPALAPTLPHMLMQLVGQVLCDSSPFCFEQEFQEHHEKILAKFVSIIGELVAGSAASSLPETDWDSMGSSSCRFIEDVIKGVSTMHKVLHHHLPPAQVQVGGCGCCGCRAPSCSSTDSTESPWCVCVLSPTGRLQPYL